MRTADLFALGAFVVILAVGLGLSALLDRARQTPEQRIRARMQRIAPSLTGRAAGAAAGAGVALFNLPRRQTRVRAWAQRYVTRVRAVGGERGLRIVVASMIAGAIAGIVVVKLVALPRVAHPAIYVGLPLIAMRASYRALVERFRLRFLEGFPTRST